jgi:hypothetical protein
LNAERVELWICVSLYTYSPPYHDLMPDAMTAY